MNIVIAAAENNDAMSWPLAIVLVAFFIMVGYVLTH